MASVAGAGGGEGVAGADAEVVPPPGEGIMVECRAGGGCLFWCRFLRSVMVRGKGREDASW